MGKVAATLGSVSFLAVAPGVVAGWLPWSLTDGWTRNTVPHPDWLIAIGALFVGAGTASLLGTFGLYVAQGRGTPAPIAPTEQLVVRGLNRYVRNPMYLAVVAMIVGQACILAQPVLFAYAVAALAAMAAFARWHEEPVLRARYGTQYRAYCDRVPAWIPRRPDRAS